MYDNLLLVSAGGFWFCCIVGAGVWWCWQRTRRQFSLPDVCLETGGKIGDCPAEVVAEPVASEHAEQPACPVRSSPTADGVSPIAWEGSASSSLRFPYPQRQWMAPCAGGRLPSVHDFITVNCHELFEDGVSFYSASCCAGETLVISLGTRATMIFMLARVVARRVQPDADPASVLVECRFIRRVREGAAGWNRTLRSCELAPESNMPSETALA